MSFLDHLNNAKFFNLTLIYFPFQLGVVIDLREKTATSNMSPLPPSSPVCAINLPFFVFASFLHEIFYVGHHALNVLEALERDPLPTHK